MLNVNKRTKTNLSLNQLFICVCNVHKYDTHYTTQHKTLTVLIIFSVILQAIIIAQMISTGGEGMVCSSPSSQP